MPGPDLIKTYLAELAGRLPAPIVAELADGLQDTYDSHRRRGLSATEAARATVTEFGEPALLAAAFTTVNPARRAARSLLLAGPVVGGAWAAVLIIHHAWSWPVASAVRAGVAAAVLTAVVLLAAAAFGTRYRIAGRSAAAGCLVVIALDVGVLGYLVSAGRLTTWPVMLAAAASTTRIGFTARYLPRILACC